MPVAEIFADDGEPAFRELERDAVADVCASPAPLVIACGGGAVLDAETGAAARGGFVVWLRRRAAVLARASATATTARCSPATRVGALDAARRDARAPRTRRPRTRRSTPTGRDVDAVADAVLDE